MLSVKRHEEPLLIFDVAGKSLRFFRSPRKAPDMPWHALDDLFVVLGLSRDMRRLQLRCAQKWFGSELKTIATEGGPATIGPHIAAQGLLAAAKQARADTVVVEQAYTRAVAAAMNALTEGLQPVAAFEFTIMAARNAGIGGDA